MLSESTFKLLLVLTAGTLFVAAPASELFEPDANSDPSAATRREATNYVGPEVSMEAMETSRPTATQLELAADYAVKNKHYDYAIKLCKRALAINDDDLDIHKSYAQALEAKMKQEKSGAADIFNACLREWLIVMRMERGPERLNNFHGLQIPGEGHWYRDEDYEIEARLHVRQLTGSTPRSWESDSAFMKRAGKQTATAVSGKLLDEAQDSDAAKASSTPKLKPGEIRPAIAKPLRYVPPPDPLDWMKE